MATISDVYTAARALLNDSASEIFADGVLLPFVKKAYGELQRKFLNHNLQVAKEISAAIAIAATIKTVTEPTDMLYPIKLEERASGSTSDDDWIEMEETEFELDKAQESTLGVWAFRKNEIQLRGATQAREIRIHYWKSLTTIVDGTTVVGVIDAVDFLASRSASIAAYVVGGNKERAKVLYDDSELILQDLLSIGTKDNQGKPSRRKPFRRGR